MGHPSFMVIVECIWINPFNEQWMSFENHPLNHQTVAICDYLKFLTQEFEGNRGKKKAR